jgi:tRNA splicing endonuclease
MKRAADVRAAAREARRVKRRYLAPPREKVDGTYDACDPQLQEQRSAWLRRLEMSRGRSAAVARWRPGERRAQVLQPKGNDVAILGSFHAGTQWLDPIEALCLLEESNLDLQDGAGRPLSVRDGYRKLLAPGGRDAARVFAVFTLLHRSGFVCRQWTAASTSSSSETGTEPPLLRVFHRHGFKRRAWIDGSPPDFVAAVFAAAEPMPTVSELRALATRCLPAPLRCACVGEHEEVLCFEVGLDCEPEICAASFEELRTQRKLPVTSTEAVATQPSPELAVGVLAHASVHVERGNTRELHGWPRGGFGEFALAAAHGAAPLVLSLVEAFYLAHQPPKPLLHVRRSASPVLGPAASAGSCWHAFLRLQPSFARKYALYRHMRVGGWNLRSGVKLGIDYTLYERQSASPPQPVPCEAASERMHAYGALRCPITQRFARSR